jgi:hypothetical protein
VLRRADLDPVPRGVQSGIDHGPAFIPHRGGNRCPADRGAGWKGKGPAWPAPEILMPFVSAARRTVPGLSVAPSDAWWHARCGCLLGPGLQRSFDPTNLPDQPGNSGDLTAAPAGGVRGAHIGPYYSARPRLSHCQMVRISRLNPPCVVPDRVHYSVVVVALLSRYMGATKTGGPAPTAGGHGSSQACWDTIAMDVTRRDHPPDRPPSDADGSLALGAAGGARVSGAVPRPRRDPRRRRPP